MAKSVTKAVKAGTGLVKTGNTFSVSYGSTSTSAAVGNDSRLSDSRAPSGSAGGDLTGTYPNPTIGSGKVTSTHILDGTIVNADINASAAIALSKLATDPLARANHTGTQTLSTISDAGTAAAKNIPATGNASATQVVYGSDTRLTDSRSPSGSAGGGLTGTYPNPTVASGTITSAMIVDATIVNADISATAAIALSKLATDPVARANHTGSQTLSTISNAGTSASKNVPATGNASISEVVYGTDTRLSDSRAPSGSAGGDLTGTFPNPTIGSSKVTSTHILDGTIVNADINASAAIALSKLATDPLARANHTGTQTASTISDFTSTVQSAISAASGVSYSAGVISLASGTGGAGLTYSSGVLAVGAGTGISVAADSISVAYGTTSITAAVGNDSRLSDSRAPSGSAGGDLTGTYPNPTLAAAGTAGTYTKVTTDAKGRVTSGTTLSATDVPTLTLSKISDAGTAASKNIPATGNASATEVVYGSDTRLTDTRTPTDNSVTSAKIVDATIVNADISATAAIALSKLATDPLARVNHTGTQTASTISDFDTQVRTSRLDQIAAPTAAVSMGSQKISNVGTPSSTNDAANKTYVDTAVSVATTAAPTRALVLFFA